MSGIFGYIYPKEKNKNTENMLDLLFSWHEQYSNGKSYKFFAENIGLGYCVNHIADVFPAPDSILGKENTYAVMDALLFNRDELIPKLYSKPEIVLEKETSISDEQLLFEVYSKYGNKGLAEVNGDFSGAVYNEDKKELSLFVNHLGVRPLYYYYDGDLFAFATDYRAILSLPDIDKSLDEELLYRRIRSMNCLEDERTIYKYIKAVKPAHVLCFDGKNAPRLNRYWKLGSKKIRNTDEADYVKKMRELIEDSINRRLNVCKGPVGGELSGGLDSSVIDILINRTGRESYFHSWSPSLEKHEMQENDERIIIEAICRDEGMQCEYNEAAGNQPKMDSYVPYDSNTPSIVQSMRYFKKSNAGIAFSGWGGDEGVSHRASMLELWHHREYSSYFKEVWYKAKESEQKYKIPARLIRILLGQIKSYIIVFKPWQAKNDLGKNVADITKKEFHKNIKNTLRKEALLFGIEPIAQIESGGNRARCELSAWIGANEGVQYVFPFLDYRAEDFAVSIPRCMFYKNSKKRYIYLRAFKDIMPKELIQFASKTDFGKASFASTNSIEKILNNIKERKALINADVWGKYIDFKKIDEMLKECDNGKYRKRDYSIVNKTLLLCCRIQMLNSITGKTPKDLDMQI